MLEEGRRKYGVGVAHPVCVLVDRAGTVWIDGEEKVDKLDLSVIRPLIKLFNHLYTVLTVSSTYLPLSSNVVTEFV